MKLKGIEPVTHVLQHQIINAPKKNAENMGLSVGAPIIEIERLRFLYDIPILLVTNYIPFSFCPALAEADLNNRSLYEFLESQTGMVIAFGIRSIEAVRANVVQSKLLEVNTGAPLLMLNSTSYLEDMTPVEYYFSYHRADRSRFEVEMIRVDS
jgi:GntR family transcriptional regulator